MQYFILDSLGQSDNEKFCLTTCQPEGLEDPDLRLDYGGSLKNIYPKNPFDVKMYLDADHPKHIKQGSFISTTECYFMVDKKVVEELKNFSIGDVEYWPFTLINHKGRIHSREYSFVCPVEQYDALDFDESEIDRDSNGTVIGVDRIVLNNKKLKKAPDLIRINDLAMFALSNTLVKALTEKYTNFAFDKAEQV
ncbi:MAG: hypothetical protein C4519_20095 [Desulfobacteraceae bacterium]|nr:MAG: hypothetical protein C4519_20095 [Desulfobacteraceae bacterium]